MADYLRTRTLFRSALVSVMDVTCRPHCACRSAEERSATHGIVFPRSGAFVRWLSRKQPVVAEPARVLFFNRHEIQRVSHPVPGGDDCTALNFEPAALVEFLRSVDPSVVDSPERPFRAPAAASTSALVLRLHRLRGHLRASGGEADPLRIEETCAALLVGCTRAAAATSKLPARAQSVGAATQAAQRELVAATRVALARKVCEKFGLAEIAREVFSSPFHLARVFRRETGTSLHRHQNLLRLRLALDRLADGAPDLTRLGLQLGFSSHAHFSQAFRREFGCAPTEFRRDLSVRRLRECKARV